MQSKNFQLMLILLIIAILICLIIWIIAAIGSMGLTDGCLYRYSFNDDGTIADSDSVSNTVTLKANANYTAIDSGESSTSLTLSQDPNSYGKWLNSHFLVSSGQRIKVQIRGDVSLCRSYVPAYNLQSISNTDPTGKKIPIPRIEDTGSEPLSLIMDATVDEWRNIAELYPGDAFIISITTDQKSNDGLSTQKDYINDTVVTTDCTDGKREYSPICGRFAVLDQQYVSTCSWKSECFQCNCHKECDIWDVFGLFCLGTETEVCDWCGCYENVMDTAPAPYSSNGQYTSPWRSSPDQYYMNFQPDCRTQSGYVLGAYQNEKYFWFSADNAAALLYRYDSDETPSNIKIQGSGYSIAEIGSNEGVYTDNSNYNVLLNELYTGNTIRYLQYRLHDDDGGYSNNTGGYVLNIKHSKCKRSNGNGASDVMAGRGLVEYVILPVGTDLNSTTETFTPTSFFPDRDGMAEITIPDNVVGTVWLKIRNLDDDYKDAFGQYQVQFFGQMKKGSFLRDILNPLFEGLKSTISNASQTIFKNMTCYQGIGGTEGNCSNFFNYIRGLLVLYITIYGMMFLVGAVQISQTDLVIRVIKITIVAGLMNENTYDLFNNYIFNFVTNFSDEMIANMSGYSLFTTNNSITNPFIFLDEVFTKIFMSKTFGAQMMALLAMGLNGMLYFIIVFVALIFIIIAALRAIAIYLMAYVAIAILIGLAPLFLTFLLFDFTRYLFDNWVRFTFRYMIEPVVMLAGVIILTQLFTIYLDYVIGYSVCWKCALPIKIPFPDIAGLSPAFLNVPIFCINWFAPWGHDHSTGQMGLNIQHIVALLLIAYCMKGYIDFSGKLVARIAGSAGGPSATRMGSDMASAAGQSALSKVGLDAQSRARMKNAAKGRLSGTKDSKELATGKDRLDRDKSDKDDKDNDSEDKDKKDKDDNSKDTKWQAARPSALNKGDSDGKDSASASRSGLSGTDAEGGDKKDSAATSDAKNDQSSSRDGSQRGGSQNNQQKDNTDAAKNDGANNDKVNKDSAGKWQRVQPSGMNKWQAVKPTALGNKGQDKGQDGTGNKSARQDLTKDSNKDAKDAGNTGKDAKAGGTSDNTESKNNQSVERKDNSKDLGRNDSGRNNSKGKSNLKDKDSKQAKLDKSKGDELGREASKDDITKDNGSKSDTSKNEASKDDSSGGEK